MPIDTKTIFPAADIARQYQHITDVLAMLADPTAVVSLNVAVGDFSLGVPLSATKDILTLLTATLTNDQQAVQAQLTAVGVAIAAVVVSPATSDAS